VADVVHNIMDFLIIGAGLAGLALAQDLKTAGATAKLLDKGRSAGGRMATRRIGQIRVDHGAQYFTARTERLKAEADTAIAEGWLQIWSHGFPQWVNGEINARPEGYPRYAPFNGMSEWAKRLAEGLDIRTGATVISAERADNNRYEVRTQEGETFHSDALIFNIPPAQLLTLARPLLTPDSVVKVEAASQGFLPSWALLMLLENDIPGANWPAIEFSEHPVLGFVSRDHTKRRAGSPPALVVHGKGDWSAAHLEDNPADAQSTLLHAVTDVFGSITPVETQIHRWRYALPTRPLTEKYVWDENARIGFIGDWCGGPRVEGAIESGRSLAPVVTQTKS